MFDVHTLQTFIPLTYLCRECHCSDELLTLRFGEDVRRLYCHKHRNDSLMESNDAPYRGGVWTNAGVRENLVASSHYLVFISKWPFLWESNCTEFLVFCLEGSAGGRG